MISERAAAFLVFAIFVGAVFLALGVVGRTARGNPSCRRCGRDARPVAWDEPPRCAGCGADLSRADSVRLAGRRRRWPELAVALCIGCALLGVYGLDTWLAKRKLQWRDLRPAALELAEIRNLGSDSLGASLSLARRLQADRLSDAQVLDWAVSAITLPATNEPWYTQLMAHGAVGSLWPQLLDVGTVTWSPAVARGPGDKPDTRVWPAVTTSVAAKLPVVTFVTRATLNGEEMPIALPGGPWAPLTIPPDIEGAGAIEVEGLCVVSAISEPALIASVLASIEIHDDTDLSDRFGMPFRVIPFRGTTSIGVSPSPGATTKGAPNAPGT
ncbi:MAG: hypothetical protein U0572_04160 [Phycisphaerales bacterium]